MGGLGLQERAESLVDSARVLAIGEQGVLRKHFPFVGEIPLPEWEFFVTVAGVFVAATQLTNSSLSDQARDSLRAAVVKRFLAWNPDAMNEFENCVAFYDKVYDALASGGADPFSENPFLSADLTGSWVVRNTLGHDPRTPEERSLARSLGTALAHAFSRWWNP